jgi:hypothetical protein
MKGYLRTCWQVIADRWAVRYEVAKPQEPRDGEAFARVTGVIVAMALLLAFGAAVYASHVYGEGALTFMAIQPEDPLNGLIVGRTGLDHRLLDLGVPWSAGATIWGVMPVCLALLGFYVAGAPRFVFRTRSATAIQGARGLALSCYASAPLILVFPAMLCCTTFGLVQHSEMFKGARSPALIMALAALGAILYLAAVLGTLYRVGQWLRRVWHCGAGMAWLGALELIGLWIAGWVFFLGAIPWCVGLTWIAIDSLR